MTRTRTRSSRSRRRPGTGRGRSSRRRAETHRPERHRGCEDYAERAERLVADAGGVLGEMVAWMDRTAKYPQPELFLGASVAALGALTGHKYRLLDGPDTRGNVLVLAQALSGGGKDHARKCVMKALDVAGLAQYNLGQNIASAEGLLAGLGNFFAGISLIDEFGLFLDAAANPHAPPYLKGIVRLMMELFSSATGLYRDRLRASTATRTPSATTSPNLAGAWWARRCRTLRRRCRPVRRPTASWPGFCS